MLCLAALAGCGGGDEKQDSGAGPAASLDQAGKRLERALESGECRALADVVIHSSRRTGKLLNTQDPPSEEECRQLARFRRGFPGYRAGTSKQFGTAGVVDAEADGKDTYSVFVRDIDGTWVQFVSGTPPANHQVGTRQERPGAFDRSAEEYLDALRAGDCRRMYRLTNPDSQQLRGGRVDLGAFCRRLRSAQRISYGLPARVRKARSFELKPLGRTREFAFYSLRLPDGGLWTLVVAATDPRVPRRLRERHEDPGVVDYLRANRDRSGAE
jgi:hypothetical protein